MKRHITNQHIDLGSTVESPNSTPEAITAETEMTTAAECDLTQQEVFPPTPRREQTLNDLLKKENLEKCISLFERENVDLAMLLQMKDTDYMDMFKDLGISAWGNRFKIKKAVRNSMVSC